MRFVRSQKMKPDMQSCTALVNLDSANKASRIRRTRSLLPQIRVLRVVRSERDAKSVSVSSCDCEGACVCRSIESNLCADDLYFRERVGYVIVHSLTHTHSHTHTLTHTHSLTHPLTHSLTHIYNSMMKLGLAMYVACCWN